MCRGVYSTYPVAKEDGAIRHNTNRSYGLGVDDPNSFCGICAESPRGRPALHNLDKLGVARTVGKLSILLFLHLYSPLRAPLHLDSLRVHPAFSVFRSKQDIPASFLWHDLKSIYISNSSYLLFLNSSQDNKNFSNSLISYFPVI